MDKSNSNDSTASQGQSFYPLVQLAFPKDNTLIINIMQQIKLKELQDKLSKTDYELMRRSVVLKCMITNACWSNWMLEKSVPERKYQPIIDEIAAQFGFVIFNNE